MTSYKYISYISVYINISFASTVLRNFSYLLSIYIYIVFIVVYIVLYIYYIIYMYKLIEDMKNCLI